MTYALGIRENLRPFLEQLLQVFFVGLTIGLQRTVIPALAETEFGVVQGSMTAIFAFIVSFGIVKGVMNFVSGRLSDVFGRKWPTVAGFFLCSGGVLAFPFLGGVTGWTVAAAVTGIGMALLYPTLIAALGDIAHPSWRGSALGVYRFWRDLGYAIGALAMGLISDASGVLEAGFWLTGAAMALSGLWLIVAMEETHPRLNPASDPEPASTCARARASVGSTAAPTPGASKPTCLIWKRVP